jgi:hypothetical protein
MRNVMIVFGCSSQLDQLAGPAADQNVSIVGWPSQ